MSAVRFLAAPEARIADLILGSAGTGRVVTAGVFKSRQFSVPLDHPEYPRSELQRTFELRWGAMGHTLGEANEYSGENSTTVRCTLMVGYRYDLDTPATGSGTTDGDSALADAQRRALDDWAVIRRALRWPPNWAGVTPPTLYGIATPGDAVTRDLGDGALVLEAPLLVDLSYDPATEWSLT